MSEAGQEEQIREILEKAGMEVKQERIRWQKRGEKAFWAGCILVVAGLLAIVALLLYVAAHFVIKFW